MATVLAFIRRWRASRPKRSIADWIALTIARGLSFAVVGGLVYVTYIVEMTGFDDFRSATRAARLPALDGSPIFGPHDCQRF